MAIVLLFILLVFGTVIVKYDEINYVKMTMPMVSLAIYGLYFALIWFNAGMSMCGIPHAEAFKWVVQFDSSLSLYVLSIPLLRRHMLIGRYMLLGSVAIATIPSMIGQVIEFVSGGLGNLKHNDTWVMLAVNMIFLLLVPCLVVCVFTSKKVRAQFNKRGYDKKLIITLLCTAVWLLLFHKFNFLFAGIK
jgi:intracellular septation protein A